MASIREQILEFGFQNAVVSHPARHSSRLCPKLPAGLACSYLYFHTIDMGTIRKTISLPEQIAKRLDKEAKRRKTSVSAIVTELVQQQPARLPYAGLIDDDEQMSQNIEQILARLGS